MPCAIRLMSMTSCQSLTRHDRYSDTTVVLFDWLISCYTPIVPLIPRTCSHFPEPEEVGIDLSCKARTPDEDLRPGPSGSSFRTIAMDQTPPNAGLTYHEHDSPMPKSGEFKWEVLLDHQFHLCYSIDTCKVLLNWTHVLLNRTYAPKSR